jgi:hypothetical protein
MMQFPLVGRDTNILKESTAFIFRKENGDSSFHQNVGTYLPNYVTSPQKTIISLLTQIFAVEMHCIFCEVRGKVVSMP